MKTLLALLLFPAMLSAQYGGDKSNTIPSGGGGKSYTLVHNTVLGATGAASSHTFTIGFTPSIGHSLVVLTWFAAAVSQGNASISDNASNTYTERTAARAASGAGGWNANLEAFDSLGITGAPTTITITFSSGTAEAFIFLFEVSVSGGSAAFNAANGRTNFSATGSNPYTQTGPSVTTSGAGFSAALFAAGSFTSGANPASGNVFTSGGNIDGTYTDTAACSYVHGSGAGSVTPVWTTTSTFGANQAANVVDYN